MLLAKTLFAKVDRKTDEKMQTLSAFVSPAGSKVRFRKRLTPESNVSRNAGKKAVPS